jgi:hypothetical protein
MTKIALTLAMLLGSTALANATLVAAFSQNPSATPTVTATDNGTTTDITVSSASTAITSGEVPLGNAFFSLTAASVDAATTLLSAVIQHYNGSFCFTTAAGCGGTNLLSGTFTDAAFGALGGPGLAVNVNNPPDTLVLTSSVLPPSDLVPPSTFGLTFANLIPGLSIDGSTIAAFTADFSGTVSASSPVAEPASLAILGIGLLGLAFVTRRKNYGDVA